jgi:predicted transposase YbfD/YdcC
VRWSRSTPIATTIRDAQADYLLAVKANQPTLRSEIESFFAAVRGHRAIENSLHRVLDVTFGDDQSPIRRGHGAKNMAVVRHFAINLARSAKDKRSVRLRRKCAGWDPTYLATILGRLPR